MKRTFFVLENTDGSGVFREFRIAALSECNPVAVLFI